MILTSVLKVINCLEIYEVWWLDRITPYMGNHQVSLGLLDDNTCYSVLRP
jgi:hypothetical protein